MPYRIAEQRAERDELVAGILAQAAGGLTGFEVSRRLRAKLGLPSGVRVGDNMGVQALRRLEAAGRVWSVTEPWKCPAGFRRVWHLIEQEART